MHFPSWLRLRARSLLLACAEVASLVGLAATGAAHAQSSQSFELKASLEYAKASDQYLMVYTSNEKSGGPNVYGRVLKADGSAVVDDFRLSTLSGKMTKPIVTYNSKQERFLVVWGRKPYDEDRAEIVGMSVGLDGGVLKPEFRISVSDLYDQRPAVAYCPGQNRFLVTWSRGLQYDYENGISDIYGQFIEGGGGALSGGNFLISSATNNQFKPDVECDAQSNRFLVVWEDQRTTANQDDIYGQLVSAEGPLIGGNFLISGTQTLERRPVLASNSQDGTFFVVWESEVVDVQKRLVGQRIDANGKLLNAPVPVAPELGGDRGRATIAYLKQQDVFLVAFDNSAIGDVSDGVYGQFISGKGKPRQTAFPLTTAKEGQYRPDVAASKNSFLVVWTDYRDTTNKDSTHQVYEYYGRVIGNDMALSTRWKNPDSK